MSFFINYIKIPFPESVNTFGLSDGFLYTFTFTGFYTPIPAANDNFNTYSTGGGVFTQLFFSGSGNWFGSGYSVSNNLYMADTFDKYQTGLLIYLLSGSDNVSGYNNTYNYFGGMTFQSGGNAQPGYSQFDSLDNYQSGAASGYDSNGVIGVGFLTGFNIYSGSNLIINTGHAGYTIWSGYY